MQTAGARDLAAYWELLVKGVDAIELVPGARWDHDAWYDPDPAKPGAISTRWGGFVPDPGRIDPAFFGISRANAETMDPQHKLLLEHSYHAVEHSGIPARKLSGSDTGVFVGVGHCDHEMILRRDPRAIDANLGVHAMRCFAANRVSYHFNLQGPSVALDTACSSSMTAIHMACQSLSSGETQLAIAGGVNVHLLPDETVSSTKMGVLSPDGRCRSFAEDAQGYARSEGCAVLVLKRERDAVADGDFIWATIRGTAINHNGASNGITAPNGPGQERVVRTALRIAGLRGKDLDYVEAHATGTKLGDKLELMALRRALDMNEGRSEPCYVGAVKTNLGHLEAAAGVAAVVKAVLAMHYERMPRNLHGESARLDLPLGAELALLNESRPWPRTPHRVRRCGVSAFGFGGSNAYAILQEGFARVDGSAAEHAPEAPDLLLVSARSEAALRVLCESNAALLRESGAALADVCFSSRTSRSPLPFRLAAQGDRYALVGALDAFRAGEASAVWHGRAARPAPIVLLVGAEAVPAHYEAWLEARCPEQVVSAREQARAACRALEDPAARERAERACTWIGLLHAWGVAPSWSVVDDEVSGVCSVFAAHLSGQPHVDAMPLGAHDLEAGEHFCLASLTEPDASPLPGAAVGLMLGGGLPLHTHWRGALITPFERQDAKQSLLAALGRLWARGLDVSFAAFDAECEHRRVPLPNYPFDTAAVELRGAAE